MKEYLISLYIDNELDLDEKITFVATVHDNRAYTDEALALLQQEKRLRHSVAVPLPAAPPLLETPASRNNFFSFWLKPMAGFAAAMLLVTLYTLLQPQPTVSTAQQHRFVVYLPETSQANIVGTFTGWSPVPMERVGNSGYWTLTLRVPEGEHRYSYLIGEGRQIADPTVSTREQDDFGGENSIIEVEVTT
jgi:hypothetical protein